MSLRKSLVISTWNLCNVLLYIQNYVKNLLNEKDIDVLFVQET